MAPDLVDLIGAADALVGSWYSVEIGPAHDGADAPDGDDWIRGDEWAQADGGRVARLLAEIAAARTGGPDVAAMFATGYFARAVVTPLVGAWRSAGVTLDLGPGSVTVHRAVGGWFDRFAVDPATAVVAAAGSSDVLAALARSIESTMTPFVECVHDLAPIGLRGLWATVGDTLVSTLLTMDRNVAASQVVAEADEILDHLTVVQTRPSLDEQGRLRFAVCCLAYKCDDGVYCGSCPLL